ncbi:hypothetical protein ABT173_19405 [Streptomyces sp. NPDC001795]|uniref:hypothetical protein n=1 Tax=unclassified Streptomyces TaxID=2593676 RepID=UPI003316D55F
MADISGYDCGRAPVLSASTPEGAALFERVHDVDIHDLHGQLTEDGPTRDGLDRRARLVKDPAFAVNSYPLICTWGRRP